MYSRRCPRDIAPLFESDRAKARAAWVAAGKTPAEREEREQSDFLKRQTTDCEIVFHSHRHAFSTAALANTDLKTAQILTRHQTTSMLTDRYAHSRVKRAAEAIETVVTDPLKPQALAQGAAQNEGQ